MKNFKKYKKHNLYYLYYLYLLKYLETLKITKTEKAKPKRTNTKLVSNIDCGVAKLSGGKICKNIIWCI